MRCPQCNSDQTDVKDSRYGDNINGKIFVPRGYRRRVRLCQCGLRFRTYEMNAADLMSLANSDPEAHNKIEQIKLIIGGGYVVNKN